MSPWRLLALHRICQNEVNRTWDHNILWQQRSPYGERRARNTRFKKWLFKRFTSTISAEHELSGVRAPRFHLHPSTRQCIGHTTYGFLGDALSPSSSLHLEQWYRCFALKFGDPVSDPTVSILSIIIASVELRCISNPVYGVARNRSTYPLSSARYIRSMPCTALWVWDSVVV
jgi:hypothetical protein